MIGVWHSATSHLREMWEAWNDFWFSPTDPATLGLIRCFTGAMLFYTHLVWSKGLSAFLGADGWLPNDLMAAKQSGRYFFSIFDYAQAPWLLWMIHVVALVIFFCLMIGFFSRTMAVLAWLLALSYVVRVTPGAFFGLDKINLMLTMYLMLGPCGARYSVDRLRRLRAGDDDDAPPSIFANLAIRLIQLHLCVIYLFGGLGKLMGEKWWNGTAVWFSVANVEYRSLDMTWIANYLWIGELATHATVFIEIFYCCAIWPRLTRPWWLLAVIGMHLGIALTMGMMTFGLIMIIANLAFVSPETIRRFFDPMAGRIASMLGAGRTDPAPVKK
jgi:uncharacterized membrane protein YphA (DoxX/SURF4 family)